MSKNPSPASWYATMRSIFPTSMRIKRRRLNREVLEGPSSRVAKKERINSRRSRAHRLEALGYSLTDEVEEKARQMVVPMLQERTVAEAIVTFTNYYNKGLMTRDNFLRVIRDIVKE